MKMIIHPGTGTIINAEECILVNTDYMPLADFSVFMQAIDEERNEDIAEMAKRHGEAL